MISAPPDPFWIAKAGLIMYSALHGRSGGPTWTPKGGFATDVHAHDWTRTPAAQLFGAAAIDPSGKKRYATAKGIAFEAKPTADGSWHGYPIPWESVPFDIKNAWLESGAVSRREVKRYLSFDQSDIHWAKMTDSR